MIEPKIKPTQHLEFTKEDKYSLSFYYELNYPKLKSQLTEFKKIFIVSCKFILLTIMYFDVVLEYGCIKIYNEINKRLNKEDKSNEGS